MVQGRLKHLITESRSGRKQLGIAWWSSRSLVHQAIPPGARIQMLRDGPRSTGVAGLWGVVIEYKRGAGLQGRAAAHRGGPAARCSVLPAPPTNWTPAFTPLQLHPSLSPCLYRGLIVPRACQPYIGQPHGRRCFTLVEMGSGPSWESSVQASFRPRFRPRRSPAGSGCAIGSGNRRCAHIGRPPAPGRSADAGGRSCRVAGAGTEVHG